MNRFVKNTRYWFGIVIIISIAINYFAIFTPLNRALKDRDLESFSLLSEAKYQTLATTVEWSFDGTKSLSSRTMIRKKIYEYYSGDATIEELIAYTDGKYHDGADTLDNLRYAYRVVDNQIIASKVLEDDPVFETDFKGGFAYSIKSYGDRMVFEVVSPIEDGETSVGYDVVGFCLEDCIESLVDEAIDVRMIMDSVEKSGYTPIAGHDFLYEAGGQVLYIHPFMDIADLVVSISQEDLYANSNQLAINALLIGILAFGLLFLVVQLVIFRQTKEMITTAEDDRDHYKNKAYTDALTGVCSRQYLSNWLEENHKEERFTVVMCDVDGLKKINDTYGHLAGDEALKTISATLLAALREEDIIIRYGGDEFLIIFDLHEADQVEAIIERVNSNLGEISDFPYQLSFSYGVRVIEDKTAFEQFIDQADRSMYRRKSKNKYSKDLGKSIDNKYFLKDIITVFCNTVDEVNSVLKHHHRRVTVISYCLGRELGLSGVYLTRLAVAAALHDIGALTVEDKEQLTLFDVKHPEQHAELGKSMLEGYDPLKEIAEMILYHHVNYEVSKTDSSVPYESYIIHLADRIDILLDSDRSSLDQARDVVSKIEEFEGTLFHPEAVDALRKISNKEMFWFDIDNMSLNDVFNRVNLDEMFYSKDKESLEQLVATLSKIVDYKSEFTATHSKGVALISGELARFMNYDEDHIWDVKIAGYLHDYGKIAVPSEIINKPGKLTTEEFNVMKSHPYFTYEILKDIKGLEQICKWASSHHENLDNTGYPMKPGWTEMEEEVEILIYADIFTALAERRPYRNAMPLKKMMEILDKEFRPAVGDKVYEVLDKNKEYLYGLVSESGGVEK